MFNPIPLGPVPANGVLMYWLLQVAREKVLPLLKDPNGILERLGDLVVWNGKQGHHVLAYLEQTVETQGRIQTVVQGIQTGQIATHAALGSLYSLSILGLGLTSLGGGYMAWRMNALQKRLAFLQQSVKDIEKNLQAKDKALLLASIEALEKYERRPNEDDRRSAKDSSLLAAKLYGQLLTDECQNGAPRRLPVMDYYARCYLVALATEMRCHILADDEPDIVRMRLDHEDPILKLAAQVTFREVMGQSPERFLDPGLQPHGVTLDLLTEIYRQAHRLDIADEADCSTASEVFERLRDRIFGAHRGSGWVFSPRGKGTEKLLSNLRFLMSFLEEASRIRSLKLRVDEAIEGRFSLRDLENWLRDLGSGAVPSRFDTVNPSTVFAFTMP